MISLELYTRKYSFFLVGRILIGCDTGNCPHDYRILTGKDYILASSADRYVLSYSHYNYTLPTFIVQTEAIRCPTISKWRKIDPLLPVPSYTCCMTAKMGWSEGSCESVRTRSYEMVRLARSNFFSRYLELNEAK